MYESVSSREVIERVEHIRELHRQIRVTSDQGRVAFTQHERKLKDFISNLRRAATRPTANMVRDLAEACSLTTDGAYRLFGYELDGIREFDLDLNDGRTHVDCLHEGLSATEADRSLAKGDLGGSRESERNKRWTHKVRRAEKPPFEKGSGNPSGQRGGCEGFVMRKGRTASAQHRDLQGLKSVVMCRDHEADCRACLILPIYRVIAGIYHPDISPSCSAVFSREDAIELALSRPPKYSR
jgi:hypothetical protein